MKRKKQVKKKKVVKDTIFYQIIVFSVLFLIFTFGLFHLTNDQFGYTCANSGSCIADLSGKPADDNQGVFMGKRVEAPSPEVNEPLNQAVLGESTGQDKHIYVDLTHQYLYAYEGNQFMFGFPISSGKWYPTPTGEFHIWIKLQYTRMVGGNPAIGTYYNLPNVPYTMYFYNDQIPQSAGYGLHGAYWHNNFGHPMSHGCVNISTENAKKLYDWADPPTTGFVTNTSADNPGTPITIFGVTPKE